MHLCEGRKKIRQFSGCTSLGLVACLRRTDQPSSWVSAQRATPPAPRSSSRPSGERTAHVPLEI